MTSAQSDDFDIAKTIFDQLKDLPSERQERVLRWIAEGLGVVPVASRSAAGSSDTQAQIPPAETHSAQLGAGGSTDIKSFIAGKAPKSDQQFAAAVAYFYRFEALPAEKRDSIDGQALQEATRLVGRQRLSNPRMTLNNAKAAGYLDTVSRGEFSINSVGENLVAMTLPGDAGAAVPKTRARKTAAKSKGAPQKKPKAKASSKVAAQRR